MGVTGAGPFENDDAFDFLDDLEDSEPDERRGKVESALGRVVGADGYIEAPLMAEGIAAAAVVAISDDPDTIGRERAVPPWLLVDPIDVDERLEELATQTLHRALRHDDNEWWERWEGAGSADEVTAVVTRYLDALGD